MKKARHCKCCSYLYFFTAYLNYNKIEKTLICTNNKKNNIGVTLWSRVSRSLISNLPIDLTLPAFLNSGKRKRKFGQNLINNLLLCLERSLELREIYGRVIITKDILMINDNAEEKIPHTGTTRPSRTCVIQEYRFYTMSLSQYHGCCQYHESLSTP